MNITAYDIAMRFYGRKEIAGAEHDPLIMSMLTLDVEWPKSGGDEVPWCSAFVNFVAWLLRCPRSYSLRARSWLEVGTPKPFEQAEVGWDVVILWRKSRTSTAGHVGFFAGIEGSHVLLLGGNQNNTVSIARYPKSRVLGVRCLRQGGATIC
jgi:uncharacterized protein (TIGR02594 family)